MEKSKWALYQLHQFIYLKDFGKAQSEELLSTGSVMWCYVHHYTATCEKRNALCQMQNCASF